MNKYVRHSDIRVAGPEVRTSFSKQRLSADIDTFPLNLSDEVKSVILYCETRHKQTNLMWNWSPLRLCGEAMSLTKDRPEARLSIGRILYFTNMKRS